MGDPVHPGADLEVQAIEKPARELDMTLRWVPTRSTGAVRELLGTLEHSPPDALVVLPDAVMLENREGSEFANRHRTPDRRPCLAFGTVRRWFL